MFFKILVLVLLAAVVANLAKALFHMSSGPDQSGQTVRALTWRISLSLALFAVLMLGARLHLIVPHGGP
jgi:hypothetical protein